MCVISVKKYQIYVQQYQFKNLKTLLSYECYEYIKYYVVYHNLKMLMTGL